jgi:hypothetical protein
MWRMVRYIIKSLPDDWVIAYPDAPAVNTRKILSAWRFQPSASTYARRVVGFSENIGPKARRSAGFVSKLDRREFDRIYDGSELGEYRQRIAREKADAETCEILKRMQL